MRTDTWTIREKDLFQYLADELGSRPGRDAFLGDVPNVVPSWLMMMGGGSEVANTLGHTITELHMEVDLQGRFTERAEAQEWCMEVLQLLPIRSDTLGGFQMVELRPGGMPAVKLQDVEVHGRGQARLHVADIGLMAVFNVVADD